jgi:hypothetical protein
MTQIISHFINIPVEHHGLLEFAFFIGVGTHTNTKSLLKISSSV